MAAGDTYLRSTDGETLLHTDGAEAIHEDCCCIKPCTHCTGVQDAAVVSASGSGDNERCPLVAGTYTYGTFGSNATCSWRWHKGSGIDEWILIITFNPSTSVWSASIINEHGGEIPIGYYSNNMTGIGCNKATGKLEGVSSPLQGDEICPNWTATITL